MTNSDIAKKAICTIIVIALIGIFMFLMFSMGEHIGRLRMQKEAIKVGFGEWAMTIEGDLPKTEFRWKKNEPSLP